MYFLSSFIIINTSVLLGNLTEKKTAGISKRNARGESQLHLAARRGNLSLVKALIESGADVNLKDNAGLDSFNFALII